MTIGLDVLIFVVIMATLSILFAINYHKNKILGELKKARLLRFLEKQNLDSNGLLEFNERIVKTYLEHVKNNEDPSSLYFPDFNDNSLSTTQIAGYEISNISSEEVVVTIEIQKDGNKILEGFTISLTERFISGIKFSGRLS